MDALKLLKQDHRTVEELFSKFENGRGKRGKDTLAKKICEELTVHAAIEEQVFYPTIREGAPDTEDLVLESYEEHKIVKTLISEIEGLDSSDESFEAKVTVLTELVREHVKEEERDMFKLVRSSFEKDELEELGARMEQAKLELEPEAQRRRRVA